MLHMEFNDACIKPAEESSNKKSLCVLTDSMNWFSVPKIIQEKEISPSL